MKLLDKVGKDHLGGVILVVMGVSVVLAGIGYKMGSLNQMGAGYIPVVLGILMTLVGVAILLTAIPKHLEAIGTHGPFKAEWRGWICILAGVVAFVVIGQYGGLMPATFASVFISAMGDRENTWRTAGLLALAMSLFCLVVFHYGLSLQLPLFGWG